MDLTGWLKHQWDRAIAALLIILAVMALLLGWAGVRDAVLATQQIPYLASAGFAGVFLLGIGATLWISADLRDEWRKLEDINEALRGDAAFTEVLTEEPQIAAPTENGNHRRQTPLSARGR